LASSFSYSGPMPTPTPPRAAKPTPEAGSGPRFRLGVVVAARFVLVFVCGRKGHRATIRAAQPPPIGHPGGCEACPQARMRNAFRILDLGINFEKPKKPL
jgi:hypothetical protein